jgi:uncharacterized membrane protein
VSTTATIPARPRPKRDLPAHTYWVMVARSLAITAGIGLLAFGPRMFTSLPNAGNLGRLHWPDFTLLAAASPAIKIHVATVVAAALVGLILMLRIKGTRLHRWLGYAYMAAMFATGVITLTIPPPPTGPHLGPFGPLHLFALFALFGVPAALWYAKQGKWMIHGRIMAGLFVGGIGIAGIGAFTPGRLMWQVFFG